MTDIEETEILERVSSSTVPIPASERWYRTPNTDSADVVFKVKIDKQGDAIINNEALDILLRIAGFHEIPANA